MEVISGCAPLGGASPCFAVAMSCQTSPVSTAASTPICKPLSTGRLSGSIKASGWALTPTGWQRSPTLEAPSEQEDDIEQEDCNVAAVQEDGTAQDDGNARQTTASIMLPWAQAAIDEVVAAMSASDGHDVQQNPCASSNSSSLAERTSRQQLFTFGLAAEEQLASLSFTSTDLSASGGFEPVVEGHHTAKDTWVSFAGELEPESPSLQEQNSSTYPTLLSSPVLEATDATRRKSPLQQCTDVVRLSNAIAGDRAKKALDLSAMFSMDLALCVDSESTCDMEKQVLRAANKRLLQATAMAHADVATLRREVDVLVAENKRLQDLWLATHPANRVRATRASSTMLNNSKGSSGTEDCVLIEEARWDKLVAETATLQEELFDSHVHLAELAASLTLEKCNCTQLRCDSALVIDKCAVLESELSQVMRAKKTSELELLELSAECEKLHNKNQQQGQQVSPTTSRRSKPWFWSSTTTVERDSC